jgi:hypothetical protein
MYQIFLENGKTTKIAQSATEFGSEKLAQVFICSFVKEKIINLLGAGVKS